MEPCYKPDVPALNVDLLFGEETFLEHVKKFKKVNFNKLKNLDEKVRKELGWEPMDVLENYKI